MSTLVGLKTARMFSIYLPNTIALGQMMMTTIDMQCLHKTNFITVHPKVGDCPFEGQGKFSEASNAMVVASSGGRTV